MSNMFESTIRLVAAVARAREKELEELVKAGVLSNIEMGQWIDRCVCERVFSMMAYGVDPWENGMPVWKGTDNHE